MVSKRGARELAQGTNWSAVGSGLKLVIATWTLLTVVSTAFQLLSFDAAAYARAGDMTAAAWLAGSGALYQILYVIAAVALVVSAVKLTRAPPASRAHPPALAAAASFVVVALLNLVLFASRQDEEQLRQFWLFVAIGRAVGVLSLLAAIVLVGREAKAKNPNALVGAAFALASVDTGFPLFRLLARTATDVQTTPQRSALLAIQLLLAVALVTLAVRVRRAVARVVRDEEARSTATKPEPELEAEEESEAPSEPEPSPTSERDSEAPSEPPPKEPEPPSQAERLFGAVLVALALAVLPLWDAVVSTSSLRAFTDALGGAPGTELPTSTIAFALGAIVAASLVGRLMPSAPYAARVVFGVAAVVAGGYALGTGYGVAVSRSHQVDDWPVCDTRLDIRGNLPAPDVIFRGRYDGPRLVDGGEPCTEAAERRDLHQREAPTGDVQDGIIQISTRFSGDRMRFFLGPALVFLALGISGWIVARSARASGKLGP